MRLLRVEFSRHRTIIYHPSIEDMVKRLRCKVGLHEYETVLEYPSVVAKEEMCLHCLKARYTLAARRVVAVDASRTAE
ncbi:MAG: hypothetical protein C4326_09260 [Ignavibacteria bacterium]